MFSYLDKIEVKIVLKIDELTILQIQEMYNKKKLSIRELVAAYLDRISLYDQGTDKPNSVLEVNPDALVIAADLERDKSTFKSRLYGVPVLLKDNFDTADRMHTSAGSLALADSYAAQDADIVKILRKKGAVIIGKTNMTEFSNSMSNGMKAGYSSRGGQVKSPYQKNADPSGSSTGSAVAVSANFCAASFGTDTSGSIISPAIKNGIVGFCPSNGTLSTKGIIPVSFTLDTAGPMTRTVLDATILYSELIDAYISEDDLNMADIAIGVNQTNIIHLNAEEHGMLNSILKKLEQSGMKLTSLNLPDIPKENLVKIQRYEFKYSINKYLSNLPRKYPIHSLKDLIEFNNSNSNRTLKYGQSIFLEVEEDTKGDLSEPIYKQLLRDREKVKNEVLETIKNYDVCIMSQNDYVMQYIGLPIITLPCGTYKDGMPYGLCLCSDQNNKLLKIAHVLERLVGHRVIPNLTI